MRIPNYFNWLHREWGPQKNQKGFCNIWKTPNAHALCWTRPFHTINETNCKKIYISPTVECQVCIAQCRCMGMHHHNLTPWCEAVQQGSRAAAWGVFGIYTSLPLSWYPVKQAQYLEKTALEIIGNFKTRDKTYFRNNLVHTVQTLKTTHCENSAHLTLR